MLKRGVKIVGAPEVVRSFRFVPGSMFGVTLSIPASGESGVVILLFVIPIKFRKTMRD